MKDWYANLDQREKRLISVAAVMLGLLLLYTGVWKPVSSEYRRLGNSVSEKEKTLAEMEVLAVQAKQLQRSARNSAHMNKGSLLGTIDRTAKSNGLGDALKRVRPEGENKASVSLEGAQFDKVIGWLEKLQRLQGISIVSSSIETQEESGLVSMRLELIGASDK